MEEAPDRDKALQLYEAYRAARSAWKDHEETVVTMYSLGEAMRCAKTGVVLLQSDEVVCDDETGEYWLRSALGLEARDAGFVVVDEEAA